MSKKKYSYIDTVLLAQRRKQRKLENHASLELISQKREGNVKTFIYKMPSQFTHSPRRRGLLSFFNARQSISANDR